MGMICFASQKGAPGTTLTALAIAASWPTPDSRRKLLLEADAAGGSLALRYQLGLETSLVTLAVAARAGLDDETLTAHTQQLPGGLAAVLAPDGPEQVRAALRASGPQLATWLGDHPGTDTIVDLGRLNDDALPFISAARALLMVARPQAEQLQPAARRMADVATVCPSVGWILVGERPHSADEIETTYGYPVVAVLPDDRRTASALESGSISPRLTRSSLVRSANSAARDLATWLHLPPPPTTREAEPVAGTSTDAQNGTEPALSVGGDR